MTYAVISLAIQENTPYSDVLHSGKNSRPSSWDYPHRVDHIYRHKIDALRQARKLPVHAHVYRVPEETPTYNLLSLGINDDATWESIRSAEWIGTCSNTLKFKGTSRSYYYFCYKVNNLVRLVGMNRKIAQDRYHRILSHVQRMESRTLNFRRENKDIWEVECDQSVRTLTTPGFMNDDQTPSQNKTYYLTNTTQNEAIERVLPWKIGGVDCWRSDCVLNRVSELSSDPVSFATLNTPDI